MKKRKREPQQLPVMHPALAGAQEYVVVCTDGHVATGPFDKKDALAKAERLTSAGGCLYVPVPFYEVPRTEATKKDDAHPGQYL